MIRDGWKAKNRNDQVCLQESEKPWQKNETHGDTRRLKG